MKIAALDSATEFGLDALAGGLGIYRSDSQGKLKLNGGTSSTTPLSFWSHSFDTERRFPAMVMRAMDSLPEGASGDKIISRILAQIAVDKRFSDLGQLGKNIPTNINVWHHAPQLVNALQEVNE